MDGIDKLKNNATFIVFIGTVLGYALGFFFEWGYLSYYGIGFNYVQIKPLEIVFGAIAALFLMVVYDIASGFMLAYDRKNTYHRALGSICLVIILVALIVAILINTNVHMPKNILEEALLIIIGFFIVLGLAFYNVIKEYLNTKNFSKSLANHYKKIDDSYEKKRLSRSQKFTISLRLIPKLVEPLMWILVGLFLSFGLGHISAGYENKYVTILKSNSSIKQIVIRDYGDQLLLKPFDTKSQKLLDGFSIVASSGNTYINTVLKCTNSFISNPQSNDSIKTECPKAV